MLHKGAHSWAGEHWEDSSPTVNKEDTLNISIMWYSVPYEPNDLIMSVLTVYHMNKMTDGAEVSQTSEKQGTIQLYFWVTKF